VLEARHAEMLQVGVDEHRRLSPWLKHFVTINGFLNEMYAVVKWNYYSG